MSDRKPRRSVVRQQFTPVFYDSDLPNGATHARQADCGYSLYRGVLVQWDEDRDTRVLDFLDTMEEGDREELLVVQEHEGSISFLWKSYVPPNYQDAQGVDVEGDHWSIYESKAVCPNEDPVAEGD